MKTRNLMASLIATSLMLSCTNPNTRTPLSEIPPPDPSRYKSLTDFARWQNPYVIVYAGHVELYRRPSSFAPDQIINVLENLPASAWPYGKIIALGEIGIRNVGDDQHIAYNLAIATNLLRRAGINVVFVPSN